MVVSPKFVAGRPVLLVDGSNLLIRLLYVRQKGSNLLTEPELITSVSEMFVHHVSEVAKKNNCSKVVVGLDLGGSVRKKSLYAAYKANRDISSVPPSVSTESKIFMRDIYPKLRDTVAELCRAFNLTVFYEFGIEADDILGILSERYNEIGQDCIILSNDSDFLQLCSMPKVSCIIPYKHACVDMISFSDYFSTSSKKTEGIKFHANEYIFYKSLVGDAGDNIKGIKGIGYKKLHKIKEEYFMAHPEASELFLSDQLAFLEECAKGLNGHKFEKLVADNLATIKLNYKLIDITSKYASATLINTSYKILRAERPSKPTKTQLLSSFATILPSGYSVQMALRSFDNFVGTGLYV